MKAPISSYFAMLLALLCPACGGEPTVTPYGVKVSYRKGTAITFSDFTLTYQGKRRVVPPQFPHGWDAYDFTARHGTSEKAVSWSAGTGDIGPAVFMIGGKEYMLELSYSDRAGRLREGELVVSRFKR
jgi:hypothetical protein